MAHRALSGPHTGHHYCPSCGWDFCDTCGWGGADCLICHRNNDCPSGPEPEDEEVPLMELEEADE